MTRRTWIVGNWKMHGSRSDAVSLASDLASLEPRQGVAAAVLPPLIWMEAVARQLAGSWIEVGAQDCSHLPEGAHTGQVSAGMIAELGTLVIVGHSERRSEVGETDALVAAKAAAAAAVGLTVVVCVGESIDARRAGTAEAFVTGQVSAVLNDLDGSALSSVHWAYEPIWAIGTGEAATPQDAESMAQSIRQTCRQVDAGFADSTHILYGGSVKPDNAAAFLAQPNVDGLLVGGASLSFPSFRQIVYAR